MPGPWRPAPNPAGVAIVCLVGLQLSLHPEWTPDVTNTYSYQHCHALPAVDRQHQEGSVSETCQQCSLVQNLCHALLGTLVTNAKLTPGMQLGR